MRCLTSLAILVVLLLPAASSSQGNDSGAPRIMVQSATTAEDVQHRTMVPERDVLATQFRSSSTYQAQPKGTFTVRNGIGILHDDGTLYAPGKPLSFGSGVTYTYTPAGSGHYRINAGPLSFEDPSSGQILVAGDDHPQTPYVSLSFVLTELGSNFRIGDSIYSKAYVSRTGVIVFSNSGRDLVFGTELFGYWDFNSFIPVRHWGPTLAVLAEPFDYLKDANISIRKSTDHATITWTNVRSRHSSVPNTFQAQLYQDGSVLMSYKSIALDHGGVGIYSGALEEQIVASAGASTTPIGPSYLGIQNVSLSLIGEAFLKVDVQTTGTLPKGSELASGEVYSFEFGGIMVSVQSSLVNGVSTGSGLYSGGPWSVQKYLGAVADSIVLNGNNVSFTVPFEVFAVLGNPHDWSITSRYKGQLAAKSGTAAFPTMNTNRLLPSLGQPSQSTSASTYDFYTSVLNGFDTRNAIVARLALLDINNYYYFPLHYSNSLPHWQLAGATVKRDNVTGLGQIEYFNDGGCDCHWGIEFIPPGELLLSGETAYYPLSHEIAHQWVFYADHLDGNGTPSSDWRLNAFSCTNSPTHLGDQIHNTSMFQNAPSGGSSLPSRSVMGGTIRNADGQVLPYQLFGFSPLELYLMGLASPLEVSPVQNYDLQGKALAPITIESVIAANGPRLPAYDGLTKTIRVPMVIVVPQNEDIDDGTLNGFSSLIESWKARFARETGGRALIDSSLPPESTGTLTTRLLNIATRGKVETVDNVMIAGFIIQGSSPKKVLIRARGPSLAAAPFNVPGTLSDPFLTLYSGATPIDSNDDFALHANAAQIPADWIPANAKEAAIVTTLNPGAYTAIVNGVGATSGVAIVEVFEIDQPGTPLINIATRGPVYTGDNVMIAGLIIQGDAPKTVLITARGPSMAGPPHNVPGTLANPTLTLYSGQTVIGTNDNWIDAANAAQIQTAIGAPSNTLESAILVTLQPGAYTAIVSGAGGGTGLAIVEVFAQ